DKMADLARMEKLAKIESTTVQPIPKLTNSEGAYSPKSGGDNGATSSTVDGKKAENLSDPSSDGKTTPETYIPDTNIDLFASSRGKDLSKLTNQQVGDLGEDISKIFLRDNNHTDIFAIQNSSGNGIDIVSRTPDGRLAFTEVKTSRTGNIGDLSKRQQNMTTFIQDVLDQAANGEGRYRNIDLADQRRARQMLREFNQAPENVSGNVIGVDLKNEILRISPWARD
ncbi:hypothetical protein, partial [Pseudomonas syringae]|uniref:hypothetical protein n=2 Tax=Pseudomonas syringae group TaxID=136849 RepID=UPI001E60A568